MAIDSRTSVEKLADKLLYKREEAFQKNQREIKSGKKLFENLQKQSIEEEGDRSHNVSITQNNQIE